MQQKKDCMWGCRYEVADYRGGGGKVRSKWDGVEVSSPAAQSAITITEWTRWEEPASMSSELLLLRNVGAMSFLMTL